jgi:hypothetical protein
MPTVRLATFALGPALQLTGPTGPPAVPRVQLRALLRVPEAMFPRDAVIDTGAPFICFPEQVWSSFREGVDFEWCPFDPSFRVPSARLTDWTFDFKIARLLVPLALLDYAAEVERPDVIAAFATGNPPAYATRKSVPPVIVGLWGGLLEGGTIAVGRDPASGHVTGALAFP